MVTMTEQAEIILEARYYLKDNEGKPRENAEGMFTRVAKAISSVEQKYMTLPVEIELIQNEFYGMLSELYFLPNSPTLMNAGTPAGTLSGCFVLPLEDSMQDIMKTATDAAMVQKFGGGTGFALSKIRPKGDPINTTQGKACGPIEILKTLSRVSSMITQGGKRDGANMAVMSIYHPDIIEFIKCKTIEGDIHNFNISVGVDTNFMKAVLNRAEYPLIHPTTNKITSWVNAFDVFSLIIDGAWKNGEPGVVFIDRINQDNHVKDAHGDMIATNPCGEQPLLSNESCNLGSINLIKFFHEGLENDDMPGDWETRIDWQKLADITKLSVRFLDNVIDANQYATSDIDVMTKATRKIGLGVMGFSDLLIAMKIPYNSEVAMTIGRVLMSFIRDIADQASLELGEIRGTFPSWKESDYGQHQPYRNACRLSVAPTGTISMIADTSSGIEPTFALAWRKSNILEGKSLYYVNKFFQDTAQEHGFYSDDLMEHLAKGRSIKEREDVPQWAKDVYVTAPDISPSEHVTMQAAFQDSVDAGISKTINFSNEATREDVQSAYLQAWETGCKGITVYRSGSRVKEVLTTGIAEQGIETCDCDTPLIVQEAGCSSCKNCGWSACEIS
jgi:ribonucleoside-diphosphate reductase alpha chain